MADENKNYVCPVKKTDLYYNMRHRERGNAIIFSHRTFSKKIGLEDRQETDIDSGRLNETFKLMGFKVVVYKDLYYKDIEAVFEEQSTSDHSNRDCIAFVFLTHGLENGQIYAYDKQYDMQSFFDYIVPDKCKTLVGKPKLFFVQACRGGRRDSGVEVKYADIEFDGFGGSGSNMNLFKIPIFSDFFISYSCFQEFLSYRTLQKASPYVNILCQVFKVYWKESDILTMMTLVNLNAATKYESPEKNKFSPCFVSNLTRLLRFTEKKFKDNCTFSV